MAENALATQHGGMKEEETTSKASKFLLLLAQIAAGIAIVYWGYRLALLIELWGVYEQQSQTHFLGGPFFRLISAATAVAAGGLILFKSKWGFLPLSFHLVVHDAFLFSLALWSWPVIFKFYRVELSIQVIYAALCFWLYRQKVLR